MEALDDEQQRERERAQLVAELGPLAHVYTCARCRHQFPTEARLQQHGSRQRFACRPDTFLPPLLTDAPHEPRWCPSFIAADEDDELHDGDEDDEKDDEDDGEDGEDDEDDEDDEHHDDEELEPDDERDADNAAAAAAPPSSSMDFNSRSYSLSLVACTPTRVRLRCTRLTGVERLEPERVPSEFVAAADRCMAFRLVHSPTDMLHEFGTFLPTYTHQLFADEEIVGYKRLAITMHFHASSLFAHLRIDYDEKLPRACDKVYETIAAQLQPDSFTTDVAEFERRMQEPFSPPGELIHEYTCSSVDTTRDTIVYQVYKDSLASPEMRAYHKRLQFFLLFYIERTSYIDDTDPLWEVLLLMEKRTCAHKQTVKYSVVGYTTLYKFLRFPDAWQLRLSQIIVLPPHQRRGHGQHLLEAVYREAEARDFALLSIEDPSPSFQFVRDVVDVTRCKKRGFFQKSPTDRGEIYSTDVAVWDASLATRIARELRITAEQVRRCYEIFKFAQLHTFTGLDPRDPRLRQSSLHHHHHQQQQHQQQQQSQQHHSDASATTTARRSTRNRSAGPTTETPSSSPLLSSSLFARSSAGSASSSSSSSLASSPLFQSLVGASPTASPLSSPLLSSHLATSSSPYAIALRQYHDELARRLECLHQVDLCVETRSYEKRQEALAELYNELVQTYGAVITRARLKA